MKKKYKIAVYAISKNESRFVHRWAESMKEADEIYVLDTGSEDDTVKLLKNEGVNVKQEIIDPWRFDVARNKSLDMVDDKIDICVCTDLDEVFLPGWRKALEDAWADDATRMSYLYHWSMNEDGTPATTFYQNKIHLRHGYVWTHPVHEVVTPIDINEKIIVGTGITLIHYPDHEKSRSQYLPLLELSVKEQPEDDRNMHYLGREYMYYKRWNECIDTLHKHLLLKSATWKDERAASMRFIARSYLGLNREEEAIFWYEKAIKEAPYLREAYVELGRLYYERKEYQNSISYLEQALEIKEKSNSYINEEFAWNSFIYDILSLDYYYLNEKDKAIEYCKEAIKMDNDPRLKENLKFFETA